MALCEPSVWNDAMCSCDCIHGVSHSCQPLRGTVLIFGAKFLAVPPQINAGQKFCVILPTNVYVCAIFQECP